MLSFARSRELFGGDSPSPRFHACEQAVVAAAAAVAACRFRPMGATARPMAPATATLPGANNSCNSRRDVVAPNSPNGSSAAATVPATAPDGTPLPTAHGPLHADPARAGSRGRGRGRGRGGELHCSDLCFIAVSSRFTARISFARAHHRCWSWRQQRSSSRGFSCTHLSLLLVLSAVPSMGSCV